PTAWGFTLTYAGPFRVVADGPRPHGWLVRLSIGSASGSAGKADGITIAALRQTGRHRLTGHDLVLRAPALTSSFVAAARRAGGPPVLLVQPYQQDDLNSTAIRLIYQRYDPVRHGLIRYDRHLTIGHGILYSVEISGDQAFWKRFGPQAQETVGTLVLFQPQ
ncbi:MAG TPA: hypothetical protein VK576_09830, partial [Thermoleophilia bacterium]|nr:hypothetical protein [Thermoleophilia bacterium]